MTSESCPICYCKVQSGPEYQPQWQLQHCSHCQTVSKHYLTNVTDEQVNESIYTEDFVLERKKEQKRLNLIAKKRVKKISKCIPPGSRILEIGCCTGEFVAHAKAAGFDVSAIDMSKSAVDYTRTKYHIPCHHGRIKQLDSSWSQYDAIVAFDVFEHLFEPRDFLSQLLNRLADGGIIYLEMPNWQSLERKLFSKHWNMIHLQDHVLFMYRDSLRWLCQDAGLEMVHYGSREAYWEMLNALVFYLLNVRRKSSATPTPDDNSPSQPAELVSKSPLKKWLSDQGINTTSAILRPFTFPFRWVQQSLGYGSELFIIARKP